jgi:hypothetical protein
MTRDPAALITDEMARSEIIESLRRTGKELDRLWYQAALAGSDEAIRFADAAQDVHRALVALAPD